MTSNTTHFLYLTPTKASVWRNGLLQPKLLFVISIAIASFQYQAPLVDIALELAMIVQELMHDFPSQFMYLRQPLYRHATLTRVLVALGMQTVDYLLQLGHVRLLPKAGASSVLAIAIARDLLLLFGGGFSDVINRGMDIGVISAGGRSTYLRVLVGWYVAIVALVQRVLYKSRG